MQEEAAAREAERAAADARAAAAGAEVTAMREVRLVQLPLHVACHMQQLAHSLPMALSARGNHVAVACNVLEPAMPAVCKPCAPADTHPVVTGHAGCPWQ